MNMERVSAWRSSKFGIILVDGARAVKIPVAFSDFERLATRRVECRRIVQIGQAIA
jgi:hypothetical protein